MAKLRFNLAQYSSGMIVPLLVLAIGFLAYFLLLPKYKEIQEQRIVLGNKKITFYNQQSQLADVNRLIADLNKKQEQLFAIDQALPTAPQIPELLANFDHLARQSGLVITVLHLTPAPTLATVGIGQAVGQIKKTEQLLETTENLAIMQADITLKGKYVNLKTLLANLEQNLRLFDISALTFGPVDEESGLQEYILKIQTYYQKP